MESVKREMSLSRALKEARAQAKAQQEQLGAMMLARQQAHGQAHDGVGEHRRRGPPAGDQGYRGQLAAGGSPRNSKGDEDRSRSRGSRSSTPALSADGSEFGGGG